MIIYKNGLITLDYTPATDVLSVELPDAVTFGVPELERSLEVVAENVQGYDIKNLLLDSSQVEVGGIDDASYKILVTKFISDLTKARLQKLARLNTAVHSYEERVVSVASEATQKHNSPFEIRTFNSKANALNWLLGQ
ncbi:hypothetical protein ACFS7Z_14830 [Pontibacter toksunensis]|uniref:SpoIIAA-like protein n=1 Tax=Pontibacter toksunensis TaxID=1332631 RepID=A0ABW6BXG4_9BACT